MTLAQLSLSLFACEPCQAWPPRRWGRSTRWLSCPTMAAASACWLSSPPKTTPRCPTLSRTSTPPLCRAGPNWCTWEKCDCSSQSETRLHAPCCGTTFECTVALRCVSVCFLQIHSWSRGEPERATDGTGNLRHVQRGQGRLQTPQWVTSN